MNAKVGDIVFFGAYEQDNNTSNGKEEIDWLVLSKENNRLLVISQYLLADKHYNEEKGHITWENCTLRSWLNKDFLNEAFNSAERAMIPTVTVAAEKNPEYDTNPGNDTQDKVFLLSITEADKYFTSDSALQCKMTPYAEAQSNWNDDYEWCEWWLRSPGYFPHYVAYVYSNGSVSNSSSTFGVYATSYGYGVRPALWIELEP